MTRTVFITGTDTGVGKTFVACGLVRAARAAGWRVAPFKPVAAGCRETPDGRRNEDALALIAAAGGGFAYADVNPYAFAEPIAPHLAARDEAVPLAIGRIRSAHARLAAGVDLVVAEGAGGWRVPLDESQDSADLVAGCGWPVVLVVGLRLGCLNHSLLAVESIERRTPLAGWVANALPPLQPRWRDNVESLRTRIRAPLLAAVGPGSDAAAAWDTQTLLGPPPNRG